MNLKLIKLKIIFKVDFNNDTDLDYNIAKFKFIMDIYIIPHLKNKHKNNGFYKEYQYQK